MMTTRSIIPPTQLQILLAITKTSPRPTERLILLPTQQRHSPSSGRIMALRWYESSTSRTHRCSRFLVSELGHVVLDDEDQVELDELDYRYYDDRDH